MKSPFRVAVINDEVTQDFGRALEIIAGEFGLEWVELRGMWNKNVMNLDAKEIEEARRLLERHRLRVTDIASPLFKTDWRGAPKSQYSPKRPEFGADFTYEQQDELLERGLELCRAFRTDRLRGFDFWRLDDVAPYREAIDARLRQAAEKAGKKSVILLLENEFACNTATSSEAARTLHAVRHPYFKLNWDPGNAAKRGDTPYPDGYRRLPKERIAHVHCKDVVRKPDAHPSEPRRRGAGSLGTAGDSGEWAAMGKGVIDWARQFRALKRDGYHAAVSLETHWRGAGTPEESTRQSWAGMKALLRQAGAW